MRLFVGIPLATAVVDELTRVTQRLRSKDDGLRWSSPESWHITLQFLGNTGRDQYECALARLYEIHLRAVPIEIDAMGFFDRAGIFFAEVKSAMSSPQPLSAALLRRRAPIIRISRWRAARATSVDYAA